MANSEEKVSQFIQAIHHYAEEQSRNIHEEVERFKQEHLARAEQQVLTEAAALVEQEQALIHNEISREMSRRDAAARQQLLARRTAIMEATFDKAKEKLTAYTATDAYPTALKSSLSQLRTVLPDNGTVYYLRPADKALLSVLQELLPTGSRLELSPDITIGGIRGENRAAGILADDTLDTRLASQVEWFEKNSGLTIER